MGRLIAYWNPSFGFIGERGEEFMRKKKVKYTDEPIGEAQVIKDFLPSPDKLVLRDETVRVTLALTKKSVDFFKKEAKINHTQYQKMIRNLLDQYTRQYQKNKRS